MYDSFLNAIIHPLKDELYFVVLSPKINKLFKRLNKHRFILHVHWLLILYFHHLLMVMIIDVVEKFVHPWWDLNAEEVSWRKRKIKMFLLSNTDARWFPPVFFCIKSSTSLFFVNCFNRSLSALFSCSSCSLSFCKTAIASSHCLDEKKNPSI